MNGRGVTGDGGNIVSEQADGPRPDVLAGVVQLRAKKRGVRPAARVQRPQRAELSHDIGLLRELLAQGFPNFREVRTCRSEFLQTSPGMAREELVLVIQQRQQLLRRQLRNVRDGRARGLAVGDFVDAAGLPEHAVVVMAFARVRPVGDEDAAVRPVD